MNDDAFEQELRKFQFTPPPQSCRIAVMAHVKKRRNVLRWLPWAALAACWALGLMLHADAGTLAWQRPASSPFPPAQPLPSPMERDEAIQKLLAEVNALLRETRQPATPRRIYPDQTNHRSHESKSNTLG